MLVKNAPFKPNTTVVCQARRLGYVSKCGVQRHTEAQDHLTVHDPKEFLTILGTVTRSAPDIDPGS